MAREELIAAMKALDNDGDVEANHFELDRLLLKFIDDAEVTAIFHSIDKWYA